MVINSFKDKLRVQREMRERMKYILTNCDHCGESYDYEPGKVYSQCPHCGRVNKR